MAAYAIEVRPRAVRALGQLDHVVRQKVAQVIEELADNPRPSGTQALTGHRPYLRVRSGDYRVIYSVDDTAKVVTIAIVGHRRDIYRNLDL